MPRMSYAEHLGSWCQLDKSLQDHPTDLLGLDAMRERFAATVREVETLRVEHERLKAKTLKTGRRLREAVERGKEAESRIRAALKANYGFMSEDLIRHGMKPRRRRHAAAIPDAPWSPPDEIEQD